MAQNIERSLSSLTAIAAASLLLSTTPALAQSQPADAQPPASAAAPPPAVEAAPATPAEQPQVAPQPAPEPASAPTMTSAPVVQALPDSSLPAATPAPQADAPAARTAPRTAAQPRATSRSTPLRPAPASQAPTPTSIAAQQPAPTDTPSPKLARRDPAGLYNADGSAVTATSTTQTVTRTSPLARYWPLEAAGGIVLIGLVGYAFTRRREDEDEEVFIATTAREPVAQPLAQAQTITLDRQQPHQAAVLPEGPVPSGTEREALLRRMVEAAPDAANPFHTVKARMRRARMILASRKQALHEEATAAFDWRTYRPSPALGNQTSPAAPTRETIK